MTTTLEYMKFSLNVYDASERNRIASVGRISLRNPPDETMTHTLRFLPKPPPADNATLIRPTGCPLLFVDSAVK